MRCYSLSKIGDLTVISRAVSERYKTHLKLPEIAKQLGVAISGRYVQKTNAAVAASICID